MFYFYIIIEEVEYFPSQLLVAAGYSAKVLKYYEENMVVFSQSFSQLMTPEQPPLQHTQHDPAHSPIAPLASLGDNHIDLQMENHSSLDIFKTPGTALRVFPSQNQAQQSRNNHAMKNIEYKTPSDFMQVRQPKFASAAKTPRERYL